MLEANKEPRYYVEWVTVHHSEETGVARLQVKGLIIRDSLDGLRIVFEHADPILVQKMLTILNEG